MDLNKTERVWLENLVREKGLTMVLEELVLICNHQEGRADDLDDGRMAKMWNEAAEAIDKVTIPLEGI